MPGGIEGLGSGGIYIPPVPQLTPKQQADADVAFLKDYMSHHDDPDYMAAHAKEAFAAYSDLKNLQQTNPGALSQADKDFINWADNTKVEVPLTFDGVTKTIDVSFAKAIQELATSHPTDAADNPFTNFDENALDALQKLQPPND